MKHLPTLSDPSKIQPKKNLEHLGSMAPGKSINKTLQCAHSFHHVDHSMRFLVSLLTNI